MFSAKIFSLLRHSYWPFLVLIALSLSFQAGLSKSPPADIKFPLSNPSNPNLQAAVHDVNKVHLVITNKGQLGWNGKIWDSVAQRGGSCLYPYPANIENLYAGGIWVGAIVGDDTLVSTGFSDYPNINELWPDPSPGGAITRRSIMNGDPGAKSDLDLTAVYTDTLTDPILVTPDPFDNRPHRPLGIKITQNSHTWSDPLADDIVIFDMQIGNIGSNHLESLYVGIFVDGDVFRYPNVTGYNDDLCGYRKLIKSFQGCNFIDTLNLAWLSDNNGLDEGDDCYFTNDRPTSVMGIRIIRAPSDSMKTSFNWWINNTNPSLDFGPRQIGTSTDPFRDFGYGLGTPVGDANKYYIMSHPEVDYDQHSITASNPGWLPPPSNALEIIDGADTRYLLSLGPFDLLPGEMLPFAFAYIGGEHFLDQFCYVHPAFGWGWYDLLDFDDIAKNAVMAGWIYDNPGVDTDGDGYLGKYRICVHDSTLVIDTLELDPSVIETTVVYTSADTFYYEGDGIPDLKMPKIPTDIPSPEPSLLLPNTYLVDQNYPNPFNPSTTISFELPRREEVALTIYNIMGQLVRKIDIGTKPAGRYSVVWDGNNSAGLPVASGIYFYRIDAGSFTASKKMVLLK